MMHDVESSPLAITSRSDSENGRSNEPGSTDQVEHGTVQSEDMLFPVDTLAPAVKDFVVEASRALPVSPDLVAVPVLATVGAAIGNARWIRPKNGWEEPPSIYAAIVADTGSMKTAALSAAVQPLRDIQTDSCETMRTWTSDATVEAIASLLQGYPRGIALIQDELVAFVESMGQYKQGRGADRQFYLSAWNGTAHTVDRKGSEAIHLPRPLVSVIGGIQPTLLDRLAGKKGEEDGFVQRFLWAFPDPTVDGWSDMEISQAVQQAYHSLVKTLANLQYENGMPTMLELTDTAQGLFKQWVIDLSRERYGDSFPDPLRGYWAKFKGYAARLALIHALASDPTALVVDRESIAAAVDQIDYFKRQARKVAGAACRSVGVGTLGRKSQLAIEGISRKLSRGRCSKRDIQRSLTDIDARIFNAAIDLLLQYGEVRIGSDGLYELTPTAGTDNRQLLSA